MTKAKRVEKLKHFITCLKCEVSGKCCDINCPTQYDAGNMGEIIENLEEIAKALEQEPILDKIRAEIETKYGHCKLTEHIVQYDGICTSANDIGDIADILQIIDRYKAESEET